MQLLEVQSVNLTTLLVTLATDIWEQTLIHAVALSSRVTNPQKNSHITLNVDSNVLC